MRTGTAPHAGSAMEIWGGVEATVNRVGDAQHCQLRASGHDWRESDLELFAELGLHTLRYPVLWERIAPHHQDTLDWAWTDRRLRRLRELNMGVVAGLLHHGCGPLYTQFLDPHFATDFAAFAGQVAARYPWITRYTPINEPLTTARFSGWYGIWHPHARDTPTFIRILLAQCKAIVLAMQRIRAVQPMAQLVQTEDLGTTYSTPELAYQAQFNNELRWLSLDLLAGRVTPGHALWDWLRDCGQADLNELAWLADHPCAPDLLGINHYVTSDRFLDTNLEAYPARCHGGNGRQRYADMEAVRCMASHRPGLLQLLPEAWQRYGLPLALTEVHIDATREDQLRWLAEAWSACMHARTRGADVRAFTAWSLLGAYDWNSLVALPTGYYEPGAFDLRAGHPQPTAVAGLLAQLARGQAPDHPVLAGPGWWRRPERFCSPPVPAAQCTSETNAWTHAPRQRPVLIAGADTALGQAFEIVCSARGLAHALWSVDEMARMNGPRLHAALAALEPWGVIDAGALGTDALASACAQHGVLMLPLQAVDRPILDMASALLDRLTDGAAGIRPRHTAAPAGWPAVHEPPQDWTWMPAGRTAPPREPVHAMTDWVLGTASI